MLNFKVNEELCIRCGKCITDCPPMCISMQEGDFPVIQDEGKCMRCQHCLAICPTGAISIMGAAPSDSIELQYELPTAHSMEALIKGRRSIRKYKKKALDDKTITKLLETAFHAPTGVNAQGVFFTATATAEATEELRKEIYTKLDAMLAKGGYDEKDLRYIYMNMANKAFKEHDMDIILRGAPHILIASAPKTVPLPKEDCIIALTTFDLLAQTMGVGTLWDGMLKWCVNDFFPELAAKLGVPEDHEIGYTMVFGRPAVQYHRTVQRTPKINLVK
ncbi:nitroreductase family protein [Desulfovibrio sp. JC010]|uniref:nitroreductase family protein n=1 Tax=Desulfovibrio sp. JC010 TaxID=2593641 RepID=UPI0013D77CA5|nr:nitroreductase family protein [Desulfovibrio sp. JC010]NDV28103.1 nitroreductase [Desulfovibrio sp. JC010]